MINNDYYNSLTGVNKVLYRTSYNFEMEHCPGATPESAHAAGLDKIARMNKMSEEARKPQTYIDLSTGKTLRCTEAELMARFA